MRILPLLPLDNFNDNGEADMHYVRMAVVLSLKNLTIPSSLPSPSPRVRRPVTVANMIIDQNGDTEARTESRIKPRITRRLSASLMIL